MYSDATFPVVLFNSCSCSSVSALHPAVFGLKKKKTCFLVREEEELTFSIISSPLEDLEGYKSLLGEGDDSI